MTETSASVAGRSVPLPGRRDLEAGAPAPLLENLLLFVRALRETGVAVSLDQVLRLVEALDWLDLGDREQVRHAARALLVTRRDDLRLFDALFARFFCRPESRPQRRPPRERPPAPREAPFTIATYLAFKARRFEEERHVADRKGTFSSLEALRRKSFAAMTPEELEAVARLVRELRFAAAERRTRRRVADPRGAAVDLRRTLRAAVRHGGVPLGLARRSPKVKARPIVLIADVSGSMEITSRIVLQFFYGLHHSLGDVESFVFGTRLTRVTTQLRLRNVDRALGEAAREVVDWAGGTRIGECLRAFNRHWGRRVLRRGAVVVIVSDGWERSDAAVLRREMRHLQRRCHRLVWLNPHSGRETYRPEVQGMAAALPFVDDFLPIQDLDSLEQLAAHLRSLPPRRGSVPRYSRSKLARPPGERATTEKEAS